MSVSATATRALQAAGRDFGLAAADSVVVRWGLLFARLQRPEDEQYVAAIELMYEGYLFHYRQSRISSPQGVERETALLAGDFFYARGLRIIAARGDSEAVGLLACLMAACAHLRSAGMPFAADDALWAYTTAGLVALRSGTSPSAVGDLFKRFDAALSEGVPFDVVTETLSSAGRLGLSDTALLEAELVNAGGGSSEGPPAAGESGR